MVAEIFRAIFCRASLNDGLEKGVAFTADGPEKGLALIVDGPGRGCLEIGCKYTYLFRLVGLRHWG